MTRKYGILRKRKNLISKETLLKICIYEKHLLSLIKIMNMEYLFSLSLYIFLFIWLGVLHDKTKKHATLIQNMESSRETQRRFTEELNEEIWKLKNPPKYKIGDNYEYTLTEKKEKWIVIGVSFNGIPHGGYSLEYLNSLMGVKIGWVYEIYNPITHEKIEVK